MTLPKISSVSVVEELRAIPAGFNANYSQLKELIKQKGLLEKQPRFLAMKMIVNAVMLAISLVILFTTDNFWLQMLNAVFMAFIFGQTGFIAHDSGHRQGFHTPQMNDIFGLIHGNALIGMSYGWWMDKHNQHHAHPNQVDLDPDIDIPVIAFSEEQALSKRGLVRFIVKHQKIFFFPLLLFEAYSLRLGSFGFLKTQMWKYRGQEILLITLHFAWYFGVIFTALPFWTGLAFIFLHQALFGLYMASVFAPNHKGMLVVPRNVQLDFFRLQVLTARNVKAHPVTDFWYGGLNYQIEHHLFPTMARNKLNEAQTIVREFCDKYNIQYYETSILNSYAEILDYLHVVSAPLRQRKLVTDAV
ncbi:MAG TPA: fatty acid desaturase [Anaerolineales bacterium]|nr:fatty acid desaturase [Anaerolineales bacterium]